MYRKGPVVDRSSLIQQASASLMVANPLIELFAEGSTAFKKSGDTGNVEETGAHVAVARR